MRILISVLFFLLLPVPLAEHNVHKKLVRKSEHDLWYDPDFHAQYELVSIPLAEEGPFRFLSLYLRRDVAAQLPAVLAQRS